MVPRVRACALLLAQLAAAGCAGVGGPVAGVASGGQGAPSLALALQEPRGVDWMTSRLDARGLGARRQAFARAQGRALAEARRWRQPGGALSLQGTWPGAGSAAWTTAGAPGVAVTAFEAAADHVPNGMATGLHTDVARKYLYMLSRNGYLMRAQLDATSWTGATRASVALGTGQTFSNTSIALSPLCTRAYVLSDAGVLFVVDTATMTVLNGSGTAIGGSTANYLAPSLDPRASYPDDSGDTLIVPTNDGNIYPVSVGVSGLPSVGAAVPVAVTTGTIPPTSCAGCDDFRDGATYYKLAAPGVAYNGHYYVGDMAGVFHDCDYAAGTQTTYALGTVAGIAAPPAIELQDAAEVVTPLDAGSPSVTVLPGDARHVFVNVTRGSGPHCVWIDLANRRVTFSQPLFTDDYTVGNARNWGSILWYTRRVGVYSTSGSNPADAVAVADTSGSTINGTSPYLANPLTVCRTGATPSGGVNTYVRFSTAGLPARAYLKGVRLRFTQNGNRATSVATPVAVRVGGYDVDGSTGWYPRGGTTAWTRTSTNPLGPTTTPLADPTTAVAMLGGATAAWSNGASYAWDVTSCLAGPIPLNQNAVALTYLGDGPSYAEGANFYGLGSGNSPTYDVSYDVPASTPTHPVETGPVIDAARRRVYVSSCNYLYCLRYDTPRAWSDTAYTPYTGSGAYYTTYQVAYLGRDPDVADAAGAIDNNDGGAFVRNKVTPAPAFDLSNLYVISTARTTNVSATYHVAVSRIGPNLGIGENGLGDTNRSTDNLSSGAVSSTVSNRLTAGTSPIPATPYGSRVMVIDPYSNLGTKGGDLYFGLAGTGAVYRIGTD